MTHREVEDVGQASGRHDGAAVQVGRRNDAAAVVKGAAVELNLEQQIVAVKDEAEVAQPADPALDVGHVKACGWNRV